MRKRILKAIILFVLSTICFVCFFGCEKTGPIPKGYYCWSADGENIYELTEADIRETFGWEIKGDTAQRWTSGSVNYKAKIVERGGKIYFEGYKWKDLLSTVESGSETIYEVVYNSSETRMVLVRNSLSKLLQ